MRLLVVLVPLVVAASPLRAATDFAAQVDPFIGTGGHGHTFPGAVTPFGMVQLSPDTRIDGSWDGCSGYHYSDSFIYGFSHTHLSGTGCSDWGDVMLMPYTGDAPKWEPSEYGSKFSHKREQASPGYYQVTLDDEAIDVELTVTPRVGFHRYTFKRGGRANVILDLNHRDRLLDGQIRIESPTRVTGYRRSEAWAKDQLVCFAIEFSKPMTGASFRTAHGVDADAAEKQGERVACNFTFDVKKGEQLLIKVALSPTSPMDAAYALGFSEPWRRVRREVVEIKDWDFTRVRSEARGSWNRELGKIEVEGGTADQRKIFYTALYHCMIHPSLATDSFGAYRGFDGELYQAGDFTYYTVFSLWDTFRALHPLLAIIDRGRTRDFVSTLLAQYRVAGRLPVWELSSNETNTMIGYHAVPVIVNAYFNRLDGLDLVRSLEAMKMSALEDTPGLEAYRRNGAISVDDDAESVSKTLEYAYDDACLARMAVWAGHGYDANAFCGRAGSWWNVFDPATGFMRPRQNGGWLTPFDPREVNNHYTEANAWQYTFFVPHDVPRLVEAMGGRDSFEKKLDGLFTTDSRTTGRTQADITGMIGQYAHGNEPSHHIAYLYNAVSKPWKTEDRVRQILTQLYRTGPDGLCGNEDCGQMSAWFVFSAIGFYPVDPGWPDYQIGWPMFDLVRIHLDDGVFTVRAPRSSRKDRYVQAARLDGERLQVSYLEVGRLQAGAVLDLEMGPRPVAWYGDHPPASLFRVPGGRRVVPSPSVRDNRLTFRDSLVVDFEPADSASVHFTTDGSTPTPDSPRFGAPFAITESARCAPSSSRHPGKRATSPPRTTTGFPTTGPSPFTPPTTASTPPAVTTASSTACAATSSGARVAGRATRGRTSRRWWIWAARKKSIISARASCRTRAHGSSCPGAPSSRSPATERRSATSSRSTTRLRPTTTPCRSATLRETLRQRTPVTCACAPRTSARSLRGTPERAAKRSSSSTRSWCGDAR